MPNSPTVQRPGTLWHYEAVIWRGTASIGERFGEGLGRAWFGATRLRPNAGVCIARRPKINQGSIFLTRARAAVTKDVLERLGPNEKRSSCYGRCWPNPPAEGSRSSPFLQRLIHPFPPRRLRREPPA